MPVGFPVLEKAIAERDRLGATAKGTRRFTPALAAPVPTPNGPAADHGVLPLALDEAPVRAEEC